MNIDGIIESLEPEVQEFFDNLQSIHVMYDMMNPGMVRDTLRNKILGLGFESHGALYDPRSLLEIFPREEVVGKLRERLQFLDDKFDVLTHKMDIPNLYLLLQAVRTKSDTLFSNLTNKKTYDDLEIKMKANGEQKPYTLGALSRTFPKHEKGLIRAAEQFLGSKNLDDFYKSVGIDLPKARYTLNDLLDKVCVFVGNRSRKFIGGIFTPERYDVMVDFLDDDFALCKYGISPRTNGIRIQKDGYSCIVRNLALPKEVPKITKALEKCDFEVVSISDRTFNQADPYKILKNISSYLSQTLDK